MQYPAIRPTIIDHHAQTKNSPAGCPGHIGSKETRELYRGTLFWGVIGMAVLVTSLTLHHLNAIENQIGQGVQGALHKRPWINDLVVVDGRTIYLRGEIEPDSGIASEIAALASIPGVSRVENRLEETPKPGAHLSLHKAGDTITAGGTLSGETLEALLPIINDSFPDLQLRDRVVIDDRLGRPLWMEGFDIGLNGIANLDRFELNGWRDQVEIIGPVPDDLERRRIGYTLPAALIDRVRVANRLYERPPATRPTLSLVSDWRGSSLSGRVGDPATAERWLDLSRTTFARRDIGNTLSVDTSLAEDPHTLLLAQLVPFLDVVHDLRLESSGAGTIIWGRVDRPGQLGRILAARNVLGLSDSVDCRIAVKPARRDATVALFGDRQRAIVEGLLPSASARDNLLQDIRESLGIEQVLGHISVEPDVAISPWLENWRELLGSLSGHVFGVTIDEGAVLLTGSVTDDDLARQLDRQLSTLFPDKNRINWVTTREP